MKKYLISGFITYYGLVIICAVFVLLGGCANKQPIEVSSVAYEIQKVETAVSQIPKWYLEIPKDKENVYSTGTATAPDLQLAVDIATINAKTTLADRINGRLDSMMKTFIAKVSNLGDLIISKTSFLIIDTEYFIIINNENTDINKNIIIFLILLFMILL